MSGRRRIGYVLSQFPCYDETFILREIEALAARDVTLTIFSLRTKTQPVIQEDARPFLPATRYCPWLSLDVLRAVLRVALSKPATLLWALGLALRAGLERPSAGVKLLALLPKTIRFAELVQAEGIEHLHAHWATFPASAALVLARLTGVSFSFTCHAHDIFLEPHLLAAKLAAAEFILTCTADNKRHLESLSPRARDTVHVSYHGLDVERFRPAERSTPTTGVAAPVQVLAVGSLLECKGFRYLLDAVALLRARGRDFRVTIAGGGPLEAELRRQAEDLRVSDVVHFTGYLTQKDLVPLYRAADLFVLPSVREIHWGIPNVLVEAAATALPIVTTALPSLPELIEDGVQGLLSRNKDAADLAEKVDRLLVDAALRRDMGARGRERVEARFDIRKTIESVVEPMVSGPVTARLASSPAAAGTGTEGGA